MEVRLDGDPDPLDQYVWDVRYVDAPVVRFHDGNTDGDLDGGSQEGDNTLYYTTDANFNVTALVDAETGEVVERYMYDPYGKATVCDEDWTPREDNASAVANDVLYCGYRFDAETGLYHVRHRYYHPSVGRFMERDPVPYSDGMNAYQYTSSNPVKLTDPMGLSSEAPHVDFKGVKITRVTTSAAFPPGVMGKTSAKISSMVFTVEIRGRKCCVVIAKAEWQIESVRYADARTFLDQAPPEGTGWTWSDYEKAKAQNMSNRDWHDKTRFCDWASAEAHENAHVAQLQDVGGTALAGYINRYNAAPTECYDDPHSAMDQANKMTDNDNYWLGAAGAITIAMMQKYGAWGVGEQGEEGAVQAERQALEAEYQAYLLMK